ncbi:MAG TPA: two-component sensor histidine kinase, partial [Nocardioides sp.]|nr:two-component sensor histidine kinase [Nocardioides sp.]
MSGLDRLSPVLRHGPTFWRRSVQARVVLSTMLLSALVVGVVGAFLIQQTRDGLLERRVDAVVQEAEGETETAREYLAAALGVEGDESRQQQALVEPIIARGSTRGFAVVLS